MAARHYLTRGAQDGSDPGPGFSTRGYLEAYPDVAMAGLNPLLHYEEHGCSEGRHPLGRRGPATSPAAEISSDDMHRLVADQGVRLGDGVREMLSGSRPGLGFSRLAQSEIARSDRPQADYTIITPTGDRPVAFNRCLQMVASQSLQPREWIIVDDGLSPLTDRLPLPDWARHIRREPAATDPPHTLALNVLAALEHVTTDRVVIMEDDDWYAPLYAEYMLPFLDGVDMVGLQLIRYYHLFGRAWKHGFQPAHTAFAQTAFRRGHAWDHLTAVCRTGFPEIRERGIVDRHWWQTFEGKKLLIPDHPPLHLGLKGGFGRPGLASGHERREADYIPDQDGTYLREALGPDYALYARWRKKFRRPYVVYTTLPDTGSGPEIKAGTGGHCDFYAFSVSDRSLSEPWEAVPYDPEWNDPKRVFDKPKFLPHLYFPDYEWSVWIAPDTLLSRDPGALIANAIATGTVMDGSERDGVWIRRHDDPEVVAAMIDMWRQGRKGRGGTTHRS